MKFFLIFTIKHFRNLCFVFGTFRNSLGNSEKINKDREKNVFNKNNKKLIEVDLVREGGGGKMLGEMAAGLCVFTATI